MPLEYDSETGTLNLTDEQRQGLIGTPFEDLTDRQIALVLGVALRAAGGLTLADPSSPGGLVFSGTLGEDPQTIVSSLLKESREAEERGEVPTVASSEEVINAFKPLGFSGPTSPASDRTGKRRRAFRAPKPGSIPPSRQPLLAGLTARPRGIPGDGTLLTTNASEANRLLGRPLLVGS